MPSTFDHTTSGLTAGTSRTLAYGPVAAATTVIVFSGTLTNIDSTNQTQHWVTLESYDGSTYTSHLYQLPIPWGSSSKIPKIVLKTGESLYVTADAASAISVRAELLVRT
jgi:hypothetical protein